jgi:hypothetical protein
VHLTNEEESRRDVGADACLKTPVHPGSTLLRLAIRRNLVSFPSQVPTFLRQPPPNMQWQIVLLFFIGGWSKAKIAARFNVSRHLIWNSLNEWSMRALALGCVQIIDAEGFAMCCRVPSDGRDNPLLAQVRSRENNGRAEEQLPHAVA